MSQQQQLTQEQAGEVLARVRNEVQQQTLQDLITKVGEKCFEKCVTKPSAKLSSSEQKCLAMCMDRYVETMTVVSQAMAERGNQEQ
jgi:mitochondrial import inner membrane translocase subunit TIM13